MWSEIASIREGALEIGGLIGWAPGQVSVSYATGNVTATGRGRVGGLIGRMEGASFANYATGNVSGTGTAQAASTWAA